MQPCTSSPWQALLLHFHKLPTLKSDLQEATAAATTDLECQAQSSVQSQQARQMKSTTPLAPHPTHQMTSRCTEGSPQQAPVSLPGHLHALVQLVNHAHQLVRRAHKALGVLPRALLCRQERDGRGQGRQAAVAVRQEFVHSVV